MSRRCDREGVAWDAGLTIGEWAYARYGFACDVLWLLWEIRSGFGREPRDHTALMQHLRERPSLP